MNGMHYLHLNNKSHYFCPHPIFCLVQNLGSLPFLPSFRFSSFQILLKDCSFWHKGPFNIHSSRSWIYSLCLSSSSPKHENFVVQLSKEKLSFQMHFPVTTERDKKKSENGFAVKKGERTVKLLRIPITLWWIATLAFLFILNGTDVTLGMELVPHSTVWGNSLPKDYQKMTIAESRIRNYFQTREQISLWKIKQVKAWSYSGS